MRALFMLHEKPDIDRLLAFVASCRQSDGSYASSPGGTGRPRRNLHGHDHHLLVAAAHAAFPPVVETAGFTPLVERRIDSTGWDGDKQLWSARDGMLIGHSPRNQPQRVPGDHPPLWQTSSSRSTSG